MFFQNDELQENENDCSDNVSEFNMAQIQSQNASFIPSINVKNFPHANIYENNILLSNLDKSKISEENLINQISVIKDK